MSLWVVLLTAVLDLDTRRRIHDHALHYPGLTIAELARALELEPNLVDYHTRALTKAGLADVESDGAFRRVYGRDAHRGTANVDRRDKPVLRLLRRPVPLGITLHLLNHPGASLSAIARALDLAPSTVHHHMRALLDADVVSGKMEGRAKEFHVADEERIERLLTLYRPPDNLVAGYLEAWDALGI